MNNLVAVACAASLLASSAAAQEPLVAEGTVEETTVAELVVRPASPGPAWWRIADDDSAVYVMVLPYYEITGHAWDRSVAERRIAGAKTFITPYDLSLASPKSIAGMGALLVQSPRLFLGTKPKGVKVDPARPPLEQVLPLEVREKFVALRTRMGHPAERYARLQPWEAQRAIERDYRAYLHLAWDGDLMGLQALAKKNKVEIRPAYKLSIPPVKLKPGATDAPSAEVAYACLGNGLDDIVAKADADRKTYLAWAQGDVRPILQQPVRRRDKTCNGPSRSFSSDNAKLAAKMEETFVRDQAAALELALKKPGRSVAVLLALSPTGSRELGLLGTRGVLERLRAKGYRISAPDVLDEAS